MIKKLQLTAVAAMMCFGATAQVNVYTNNNVGVGSAATSANSVLSVNTPGTTGSTVTVEAKSRCGVLVSNIPSTLTSCTFGDDIGFATSLNSSSGRGTYIGAYNVSLGDETGNSGRTCGVWGNAGGATNGYNFGVIGQLRGAKAGMAVCGTVSAGWPTAVSSQYAGYFIGNVQIDGTLFTTTGLVSKSDQRFKKNIVDLDSSKSIYNLRPVKYNLKTPKEELALRKSLSKQTSATDTSKYIVEPDMPSPQYVKKKHYGFLAQDVQLIYPDLVYESEDGLLGIDYIGFIPIIIDQLKAQKQDCDAKTAQISKLQAQANAQQAQIDELIKAVNKLKR